MNSFKFKRASLLFWTRRIFLHTILAGLMSIAAYSFAQETRKLKSGNPPEYPDLAQRLGIKGMARVEATVLPDGTVKEVKELGGNPVLVQALASAVKKWKYEPAQQTTIVEVKVIFGPH